MSLLDKGDVGERLREHSPEKNPSHSQKAYSGFFEGYREYAIPKTSGKGTKIERVYVDDWYYQVLPIGKKICVRVLYLLLYILAWTLFLFGAVHPDGGNFAIYVSAAQVLVTFCLLLFLLAFFRYIIHAGKLTAYEFKSSARQIKRAAGGGAVSFFLLTAMNGLWILLNLDLYEKRFIITLLGYLLGGVAMLAIHLVERGIVYERVPNDNLRLWKERIKTLNPTDN